MTELSKKRSLSGMTFKPLTENRGEELLTSYLAAFPVKTSPAPEREQGSQENGHPCGHTWRELCLKCDPDTSMLKTVRCLWEEVLEPSSVTLPKWGMMQDGELWERTTLPRHIKETESGSSESWRTPKATEYMPPLTSEMIANICPQKMAKRGKHSLATQVENKSMWPTPTCQEVEHPDAELTETGRRKSKDGNSSHSLNLADSVKQWPTPTTRDYKGVPPEGYFRDGELQTDTVDRAVHAVSDGNTQGQLSPDWVEWLMGWPIGWTRLEPIELDERGWETDPADNPGDIPRVATGIKARADRLKAIGNGQVPQAAELAWRILTQ